MSVIKDMRSIMDLVESLQDETLSENEIKILIDSYLITALWSSVDTVDGEDVELDNFVYSDECKNTLKEKIKKFVDEHGALIRQVMDDNNIKADAIGHSIWLSQNGHGAGLFDYEGEAASKLHDLCDGQGTDLYLGDDELVYCTESTINESVNLELYYETYSEAVQAARAYAESKGFYVDEDEWFTYVTTGQGKPAAGKTTTHKLALMKDGVEVKKQLVINVYNRETDRLTFELNAYVA